MVVQKLKGTAMLKLGLVVAFTDEFDEDSGVKEWASGCWDFYYEFNRVCMFPPIYATTRRALILK